MAYNEYGLDDRYFKEQLNIIISNVENYTPDEMHRALNRLRQVAKRQIGDAEFNIKHRQAKP